MSNSWIALVLNSSKCLAGVALGSASRVPLQDVEGVIVDSPVVSDYASTSCCAAIAFMRRRSYSVRPAVATGPRPAFYRFVLR